jgi:hypothetical protein
MARSLHTLSLTLALVACTGTSAQDAAQDRSVESVSSTGTTLASGTRVAATTQAVLSSRTSAAGETLRAVVSRDVLDNRGRVVIPAGATVILSVLQLEPGSDQIRPEGRLSLAVTSVTMDGTTYPLHGTLDAVSHHLEGRGVTTHEAARIGAGTAIGALAGQLIGKNQRSTVIGGAVGAVAGTAVAVRYAYRDVVVSAGTPIAFTLTQSLNLSAR